MKDARGHGSVGLHGGAPLSPLTARGRGIMPSKPFRESQPSAHVRHTDTDKRVFGLRQQAAQTSPGHARVLLQGIKNLVGLP